MRVIHHADIRRWEKVDDPRVLASSHGLQLGTQSFVHPTAGTTEDFSYFTKREGFTICAKMTTGELLLVRQYKQAADQIVTEFPCGVMQKGETPDQAAMRELREETAFECSSMHATSLEPILLAPRKSPSGFRTFVAFGCVPAGVQRLDKNEDAIEVLAMTVDEFRRDVQVGKIRSVETIVAMQMATLVFPHLFQR